MDEEDKMRRGWFDEEKRRSRREINKKGFEPHKTSSQSNVFSSLWAMKRSKQKIKTPKLKQKSS